MSQSWRKGARRGYNHYRRVTRPAVLARAEGKCQLALPGTWRNRKGEEVQCKGVADCVHHTHGIGETGHDMRYMVAACTPCNLKVGDPTRVPDPPVTRPRWL